MKKHALAFLLNFICVLAFTQKLDIENKYQFKSLKKDSYLGSVEYNPKDKTTSLYYVEKDMLITVFTTYIFNEKLEFVKEESQSFNIIDATKEAIAQVQEAFTWFDYQGESYTKEWIDVNPGIGGKLLVTKQKAFCLVTSNLPPIPGLTSIHSLV